MCSYKRSGGEEKEEEEKEMSRAWPKDLDTECAFIGQDPEDVLRQTSEIGNVLKKYCDGCKEIERCPVRKLAKKRKLTEG